MLIPYLFLSGLVAPLSTFPPAMQRLAAATPFPSMVAFPAGLLAGEPLDIVTGFSRTLAWCALLLPIALLLWRAGIRRYSAMGA
jgi:ABC-2 type transport system permease protein